MPLGWEEDAKTLRGIDDVAMSFALAAVKIVTALKGTECMSNK